MLVLSRKRGEKVILRVGDLEFEVAVLEVEGGRVRLGIEAPASVSVRRKEVADALAGLSIAKSGETR